jgi:pyruvate/2-oxoglutarate dehydrogenase complex dihydrolipoamide acyltransferase (E2) component
MRRVIPLLIAFLAFVPPAEAAWVWPVSGEVITPYRNGTDPYATGQHRGIDIAAPVATPVVAAAGGDVRFAGTAGSSGLTIGIRTADGYDTAYLHLSSLSVRAGAHVSAGDRIGAVGTTGSRSATAPHLHFGVRDAGTRHDYRDPLSLLPPPPPAASPDPPAAAPAPVPAPEPAQPPPSPVTAPRAAPAPRGVPSPVPHRKPRLAPHPRSAPPPRQAPRGAFAPRAVPHSPSTPALRTSRPPRAAHLPQHIVRTQRPEPIRSRDLAAGSGSAEPRTLDARPTPAAAQRAHQSGGDGPDLGWIAACAGLLLAAAVLGVSADRRPPGSAARAERRAALNPLARLIGSR